MSPGRLMELLRMQFEVRDLTDSWRSGEHSVPDDCDANAGHVTVLGGDLMDTEDLLAALYGKITMLAENHRLAINFDLREGMAQPMRLFIFESPCIKPGKYPYAHIVCGLGGRLLAKAA